MLAGYVILHAIVVGHTGVMANCNRGILGALRVRPSRLAECLHQMATLGCRYSCAMLKGFGRNGFQTVEPVPDELSYNQHQIALQAPYVMVTATRTVGGSKGSQQMQLVVGLQGSAHARSHLVVLGSAAMLKSPCECAQALRCPNPMHLTLSCHPACKPPEIVTSLRRSPRLALKHDSVACAPNHVVCHSCSA